MNKRTFPPAPIKAADPFWRRLCLIANNQRWSILQTFVYLSRHALGMYEAGRYDRADMELIIKGIPIEQLSIETADRTID